MSESGQAMDAIREVGPGKHFLGCAHTQANFETAFFPSPLADNNSYEQWDRGRPAGHGERANALWKKLLRDYEAPPIDPAVDEALLDYIERGGKAAFRTRRLTDSSNPCEGKPDRRGDSMADEELDLNSLSDEELVGQMHDDLYDGLKDEIERGRASCSARGWTPYDILTQALVEGMRIVGIDFRDGILFVPEVLLSANAMKAGMAILRPLLAETGAPKVGKMVIGTVKGDIHDIGKNLVCMMMEGAGFEVIDLGINNGVEKYLAAIEEHQPDILGMSALLTTTMPYMKVVIDTLKEKGIRNDYIVLVGGAPLNEAFANAIGADAYCRDAAVAVETAKTFMAQASGFRAGAGVAITSDASRRTPSPIPVSPARPCRAARCGCGACVTPPDWRASTSGSSAFCARWTRCSAASATRVWNAPSPASNGW